MLKRHPLPSPKIFHPVRHRERTSTVKNRMREICTSGSVRDGGGNVPIYSAPCEEKRRLVRANPSTPVSIR